MTLTAANTFTGTTTVCGGELEMESASGNALSGDVEIAGGTLAYGGENHQIADTAAITMTSGAFNVASRTETAASLTMSGGTLTKGRRHAHVHRRIIRHRGNGHHHDDHRDALISAARSLWAQCHSSIT